MMLQLKSLYAILGEVSIGGNLKKQIEYEYIQMNCRINFSSVYICILFFLWNKLNDKMQWCKETERENQF